MSINVSPVNKNIVVTDDGKAYQPAGVAKTTGAVVAGFGVGSLAWAIPAQVGQIPIATSMIKGINLDVSLDAVNRAFNNTGLAQKGVNIIDASTEAGVKTMNATLENAVPSFVKKIPILNRMLNRQLSNASAMTEAGVNAFFIPRANKIIINSKGKMNWAIFHEMGHAMNKNYGILGKVLAKTKIAGGIVAMTAIATALFKRKKVDGEKPQGTFDKITTFVKNNCGTIALLGWTPTLLEEGLATIKGNKIASKVLSPDQLKTLKKLNGKAWLTYVGMAVGAALLATVGSKVRDSIAKPKEIGTN
jgi:hypothetical protein